MTEWIGWISSIVLLLTILQQLRKQWQTASSAGVSKWLFVGQMTASFGFTWYSIRVSNWVFTVTNSLLLLSSIVGCAMTVRFRRRAKRNERTPGSRDLEEAPSGA
jgi:MtN3 and saliva related transmembrane protein